MNTTVTVDAPAFCPRFRAYQLRPMRPDVLAWVGEQIEPYRGMASFNQLFWLAHQSVPESVAGSLRRWYFRNRLGMVWRTGQDDHEPEPVRTPARIRGSRCRTDQPTR